MKSVQKDMEERSADARRYDYLAFVRSAQLLRMERREPAPPGVSNPIRDGAIDACELRALRIWITLDETQRTLVDPRFRPGAKKGP
jgi:hypothetical protein